MMSARSKPRSWKILVVIPCLNEEASIGQVVLQALRLRSEYPRLEVLVVDDGSQDATAECARQHGAMVLSHSLNLGVGSAFHSGVTFAIERGYNVMINIDGDGQFNPEDMSKLLAPIIEGRADMATASRFKDPDLIPVMPPAKRIGNAMMSYLISRLLGKRFYDVSCGFRCYSREALLRLNLHGSFTYTQESFLDLCSKNMRVVEVPVAVKYFPDRVSRIARSLFRYAGASGSIIFRAYRDYYPFSFFSYIAIGFLVPAVAFGLVFAAHFFLTGRFSDFLFAGFVSGFLLALAALFFVIGIVADMLDRIRGNQERILYMLKVNSRRVEDPYDPMTDQAMIDPDSDKAVPRLTESEKDSHGD
jgi:glycosyltransferase involved in cell wall biosynthesis